MDTPHNARSSIEERQCVRHPHVQRRYVASMQAFYDTLERRLANTGPVTPSKLSEALTVGDQAYKNSVLRLRRIWG